ncbi:MAG: glycerate kinase [SAR202 cluster bacterium]|nr:glycerate kinase [SAR202 cluster bacterium]
MKVLIAPQAFKGSLSGPQVAQAIQQGVLQVFPQAQCHLLPIADGGDGTLEALIHASGGRTFTSQATGPLSEPVEAHWGVMGDGKTAVIEMAQASGLVLVPQGRRDPRHTTTLGTGELIKEALDKGYRCFIIGIGGSATNDGGAGMASALGVRFLDKQGYELPPGGLPLATLDSIDVSNLHPVLGQARITVATDVTNPLCGPQGASAVYGPQKGATAPMVEALDKALQRYADVIKKSLGKDLAHRPGAGAAGGLGAGLMAFTGAELRSGIDIVCDALDLDRKLEGASLVITGEGRIDASTVFNKAPIGVARRAKAKGVPVIALAASLGEGYQEVYKHGIDAIACIADRPMPIRESIRRAHDLVAAAAERALHFLTILPPR